MMTGLKPLLVHVTNNLNQRVSGRKQRMCDDQGKQPDPGKRMALNQLHVSVVTKCEVDTRKELA